jgi:hypothetical protein
MHANALISIFFRKCRYLHRGLVVGGLSSAQQGRNLD